MAVSIIRLYTLDDLANSTDLTFDNSDHATMSVVEANVGIVCACIPAMRPLFALMMPKYFSPAVLGNKEPTKDVERAKHIEYKRTQSVYQQGNPSQSSTQPSWKHSSSRASLTSKVSLHSRPSTVFAPSSSKASLSSPKPATIRNFKGSDSSRLPTSIPEARLSRSQTRSFTHSRSNSTSQSRPTSHIAMASIKYPARSIGHSRSASNLTTASCARGSFPGSPLLQRLPTLTPSESFPAQRLSRPVESDTVSLLPSTAYGRRPSDSSLYLTRMSSAPTSTKPLPVTPFPVGMNKYMPLEIEEESER